LEAWAVSDYEDDRLTGLADRLQPLANATRLRLLCELREPQTLSEITIRQPGGERSKPLARQTVKSHLVRLIEADAVTARQAQRRYGETTEYMLNNQQLFALAEELRDLSRLTPSEDPTEDTVSGRAQLGEIEAEGPHLVLVKGVPEGRIVELTDDERWVIGRKRGLAVPLPSDPFVSVENTVIEREGSTYRIADLPQSRNGTVVNGSDLAADESHELSVGDLVQVGKSTLIFRT
jgi:pSer/pThr/pTyr-binding forkhead associated (FHA) protein